MKTVSFIFICTFYLVLSFFASGIEINLTQQLVASSILILLIGIPHGAIDHVIFLEEKKIPVSHFYFYYLTLIGFYLIAWFLFPSWSFGFFLLLSAFHFGESQFSDILIKPKHLGKLLNLAWGTSILSGLIYYNFIELGQIFLNEPDILSVLQSIGKEAFFIILIISTTTSLLILGFQVLGKSILWERMLLEVFLLGIIHFSLFVLPVLIGFLLYFIILHSLRVLFEEYTYLKQRNIQLNLGSFLKLLVPYTTVSFFGGIAFIILHFLNISTISLALLPVILISVLTLPHSIVMNNFYDRLYLKK